MLLAKTYDATKHNPTGWWVSEKLDGVRALWDPVRKELRSRNGLTFVAPKFFITNAPAHALDGEIWHSRGSFEKTGSIRKSVPNEDEWAEFTFMIFDAPEHGGPYEERMAFLNKLDMPKHFKVLSNIKCKGHDHLMELLDEYEKRGAEGLMLRKPGSRYENKRSDTLLKVKTFEDDEATVIEHLEGTGRLKDLVGALRVRDKEGHEFKIGTGFTDEQRLPANAPKIGTVVTYKYFEKTKNGVPRFPVFLRVRHDAAMTSETSEKVPKTSEKKVPKTSEKKVPKTSEKVHKTSEKKTSEIATTSSDHEVIDLTSEDDD